MNLADLSDIVEFDGKYIYSFCYKLTKNKHDSDDLYQETFLKAIELCHKIDIGKNPKAYLISIAIRLWKNNRRKYAWRQRIVRMEPLNEEQYNASAINPETTPEDITITRELNLMIQKAADKLSDKYKLPLYMYYTVGLSIDDIAMALKIPSGTVKSRLHRARRSLKNELEVSNYG